MPVSAITSSIVTSCDSSGISALLKIGDIVKAEVMEAPGPVTALRISLSGGREGVIKANSDIALQKGDILTLKVAGLGRDIRFQLIEKIEPGQEPVPVTIPEKILELFSELAASRMKSSDMDLAGPLFRSFPSHIRTEFPEFELLERLMPQIETLNSELLKESVEGSGVLFEARLKTLFQNMSNGNQDGKLSGLPGLPDQKALLLRIRELLNNDRVADAFKYSGIKLADTARVIEGMLKNIEFFQLSSKISNMLYTFLPVSWKDLKDGELSMRKDNEEGRSSYTCNVTLDLEQSGKVAISVTLFEGSFYISLFAEKTGTRSMIVDGKVLLEKRFYDSRLPLKIINISTRHEITFGPGSRQGLNLRI